MKVFRLLLASVVTLVAESASATTVLHQIVTTKKDGKGEAREQATVTYLDGERFRVERFSGKTETGEWVALILFDGKQTLNCRRGKQNTCRSTQSGPLSELDAFLGKPGMKVTVTSFSFTPAGAAKKVAGEACLPHKLDMQVNAEIELNGIKLPGGFKPALQGSITGNSCVGKFAEWNPKALLTQLTSAKAFFATTAAFDAFVAAAKVGAGFELEGDTAVKANVGGSGIPDLNSTGKKTTIKVETKKPALSKDQLQLPADFVLAK